MYLIAPDLDDEWRPDRSKFVLVSDLQGSRLNAIVDPQRPDAWRREPYYTRLKELALAAAPHQGQVIATIGKRVFVILPDRDVDLGIVEDDERIITREIDTVIGIRLDAMKMHKDDPRIKGRPTKG